MTNKQQKLADKCANIEPLDGRILIAPNRVRTYKELGHKTYPADPNIKEADVIHGETEMVMEETLIDVNYRYQTGVVVQKSVDETRFNVGDTIIYGIGAPIEFDYIKGVSILKKYDVIGVLRD